MSKHKEADTNKRVLLFPNKCSEYYTGFIGYSSRGVFHQNKKSMYLNGKINGFVIRFNCNGFLTRVSHYVNNKKQGLEVIIKKHYGKVDWLYFVEGKEYFKLQDECKSDELMEKYGYRDANNATGEDDYISFFYDCWEQFLSLAKSEYAYHHLRETDFISEWKNPWMREMKMRESNIGKCGNQ
jgi:hypothetical protein